MPLIQVFCDSMANGISVKQQKEEQILSESIFSNKFRLLKLKGYPTSPSTISISPLPGSYESD